MVWKTSAADRLESWISLLISVCVPTIRADTLPFTVAAIRAQTWADWELILVSQGDDPALRAACAAAEEQDARIRNVHMLQRGASIARNDGVNAAQGDVVAFTDDDCEPDSDWLRVIAYGFRDDERVDVIGGNLIAPATRLSRFAACPQMILFESVYDPVSSQRHPPTGWDWITANVALRRAVFESNGLFDPFLGPGARFPIAEDTDFKLRLEAAGVRMRSTPDSVVQHTYGYRSGLRARLSLARNYARGNGALAAKLTLAGDPRGVEWLGLTRNYWRDNLRRARPHRALAALHHLREYERAYAECLANFVVDPVTHVLAPRAPRPRPATSAQS